MLPLNFKDILLPEGIEIIAISKDQDDKYPLDDNNIFLLSENNTLLYLKVSDDNRIIAVPELRQIVETIKKVLAKEYSIEDKLKDWFSNRWQQDNLTVDKIPSWVEIAKNWQNGWFSLILFKQGNNLWEESFKDLLYSYLDVDFFEIIISSSAMVVVVSNENLQFSKDNLNEIEEFAQGFFEMLQNEWSEEIKVGVHLPVSNLENLLTGGKELLVAGKWVKLLWQNITILTPWSYRLEQLIFKLPENELVKFADNYQKDKEISKTLEVFFKENLNMSETARRLFIHRNTLQYRLDKFKQQTGLDVKCFEEATIAKVLLLINKALDNLYNLR